MIDTKQMKLSLDHAASQLADITECLLLLYGTREGSQPLDRNFGLSNSFVGKPVPVARNEFVLEITQKTEQYEPRVCVTDVTFQADDSGKLIPLIRIGKKE